MGGASGGTPHFCSTTENDGREMLWFSVAHGKFEVLFGGVSLLFVQWPVGVGDNISIVLLWSSSRDSFQAPRKVGSDGRCHWQQQEHPFGGIAVEVEMSSLRVSVCSKASLEDSMLRLTFVCFFDMFDNERRFLTWPVWFVDRFQLVTACESVCAEGGSM